MHSPLELLAPAGSLDVFQTAVENGANAIYIGAPAVNARALARHFTFEEIAAMTDFAHQRRVKLYVAMNSLVKEEDLPVVVELLSVLAGIGVDALIIQDLGIYRLARRYFPELRLHASTLLGAHNSINVRQLAEMGFARVVLAREMRIDEIATAANASPAEVEVFVHGAMCFAYSGLCLFSSFLGGKSGLRGRCVQPCRRKYSWRGGPAKGGGYLFSMNDLEGIGLIDQLREAGVSSLKIEGRMRSRQYVGAVVSAYRLALDHPGDDVALREAGKILAQAMGRKTSTGYFLPGTDENLITHQYSGNIGLFLGKVTHCRQGRAELKLREPLLLGDRIRVHNEKSGERDSLTVRELWLAGRQVQEAEAGQTVRLSVPESAQTNDPVYKVDTSDSRQNAAKANSFAPQKFKKLVDKERNRDRIRTVVAQVAPKTKAHPARRSVVPEGGPKSGAPFRPGRGQRKDASVSSGPPLPWWLKIDDLIVLNQLPRHNLPARVVVLLTQETLRQLKRLAVAGDLRRSLIWALPPIIVEPDLAFYRQAIALLFRQGFFDWQIAHVGQLQLLIEVMRAGGEAEESLSQIRKKSSRTKRPPDRSRKSRLMLYGHYSLNVMNSQALQALADMGIATSQVSIEADRDLVAVLTPHRQKGLGMTVYGFPPLFTARPSPGFFSFGQTFVSPKGEEFVLAKSFGQTLAVPTDPFSLLDRLDDLKALGLDYVVVDLSGGLRKRGDLALL
ncbi:MAG: U32 family peptidase, partial [Proteobacteria bacterium]|nr:U32 family peptidase [Pseudomonadota bacterium]